MKSNRRRDFLKSAGALGMGLFGAGHASAKSILPLEAQYGTSRNQQFNMCGYAAPKLETVRIGIVGLGMRGPGAVDRLSKIEGVEIKALCDLIPER
ncbi:MAG: acetylgalactosaminidase, partial [Cyclobacteriaceae bacterium]|nr:acetylgalactosaminidase [Cyclobacteriaceae bacterium]